MYNCLEKVGVLCLFIVALQITRIVIRLLYNNVIGSLLKKNVNLKEMGRWAVVTGATDGIGKAYAEALAKLGIDVILISRTKTKLEAVAAEIEAEYHVHTKIIEADFTNDSYDTYHAIEKELYGMEIGILINNVGMSSPHPAYFLELPNRDKVYSDIIKCNIGSVTNMSLMILPQMVERKKGVVVNVSSVTAIIPSPLLTVYASTKAFIEKFSKDLACEYGKCGIVIQCILPGYVATKMSKIRRSTWMAPAPDVFVESAIHKIGIQQHTTGYFPHSLMVGAINLMDGISSSFARWVIVRTMENIRGRALKQSHR